MDLQKDDFGASLPRRVSSDDLTKLLQYYRKGLTREATDYLRRRGIKAETAEKFELGFEPFQIGFYTPQGKLGGYFTNCLVFPVRDANGLLVDLIGRGINGAKPKYKALVGRGDVFYNEQILSHSEDVLLCKNVFDALSLEQVDLPTLSLLDSTFKEAHAKKLADKRVFICYPNDDKGRRESNRIAGLLQEVARETYTVFLPEGFRDINHFFVQVKNPPEAFRKLLKDIVDESLKTPVSADARNLVVFLEEFQKRHHGESPGISTGFSELDEKLVGGLRTGLYLFTGEGSIGKSMLLRQMADYIAAEDTPVVYVSWDMTGFELWARSIARLLGVAPKQVIAGQVPLEQVNQANQNYAKLAKNMWTFEGGVDTMLPEVEDYIERIKQTIGRAPIVFIDHLLRIPYRDKEGRIVQQNYALVSYALHQWSRQWDTPIVVAAPEQIHRHPMSGSVEAAADVILTLRLATEEADEREEERKEKVSLYLKKNRNGTLGALHFEFDKQKAIFRILSST
ncbi:hypothetical protein BEP19_01685 [Ammoniphilus oxalaticus]|uniref:SF4 helicase domain-containing protein n=1 Tax=Ammoniphilus oxalaticus TaxID=66863 RepID=A0A419SN89_9BACL|nr:DnaB-like helicase C-terminal domain-containing protein [Ammoniphilus oxalaticus]RKD25679.1 hypothetical protein BEP19_01685 [Ammoniphilus oxalaticus]